MKRWLIVLGFAVLLLIAATYIFIPNKLKISYSVFVKANQQGAHRFLADSSNWVKWWPDDNSPNEASLHYGSYNFRVNKVLYNAFEINITNNNRSRVSLLQIFSNATDSITIQWSTEFTAGLNPLARLRHYFAAKEMDKHFKNILAALKKHLSSLKNIYGVDITQEKVQFQLLISTKQSFAHYPSNGEIYAMVNKLKGHLSEDEAKIERSPLLNIQAVDSSKYAVQVALPVDKRTSEHDNISVKWMMKGGNILVGEVVGGPERINHAMKEFEKYISDYQRSVIAIPFQLLITDRMKQPDSSKWVTRIYYPVT